MARHATEFPQFIRPESAPWTRELAERLCELAAPLCDYGPNYRRNIAEKREAISDSINRGDAPNVYSMACAGLVASLYCLPLALVPDGLGELEADRLGL